MITLFKNTKLKSIAKIYSGNSINEKIKEKNYTGIENGVDYISTKDIGFDYSINYNNGVKIPFNKIESFKKAPKNTVFICAEGGSAGRKIAISNRELCFVNKLFAIEVSDKVISKYVFYSLISRDFLSAFRTQATGIVGGVSLNKFKELEIPLPPLPIQQKIVSKLDAIFVEIDKVMAAAEANSKNAEVLFQSYLNSIFKLKGNNWITTKLNEICEKITDGTHQTPTYFDDGVIFLSSKNVTTGKIDWDNIKYIDTKQHIEMSKSISPKVGDILLAKNGTTGVAAMVDKDIVFNIYVSLALLRAKAQVLPKLLLYFINSPVAKKQFNSRLKGSGVPNLHLQEIRQVEISFPKSLENQRELILQIERFLDVTSILITKYKNKKNEILLLKQAILKQAFNGELVKAA